MADNLTNQNGQWVSGCGCGGKAKTVHTVPENSKAVLIRLYGQQTGPVTGILYNILPHQISIDIHTEDADYWLGKGQATLPLPGQRGRTARVDSGTT